MCLASLKSRIRDDFDSSTLGALFDMMTPMATTFEFDLEYAATPDEVYEMIGDPEFRSAVCERQAVLRHEVDVSPAAEGEGMEVFVSQDYETTLVPSFARGLVGDQVTLERRETWVSMVDGADILVTIPGKPGQLTGRIEFYETDEHAIERISGQIVVNIPLLGGKLEGMIADLLVMALKAEGSVGRKWLAGER